MRLRRSREEGKARQGRASLQQTLQDQRDAGLHPCGAICSKYGTCCEYVSLKEKSLQHHITMKKHIYPTPSFQQRIISWAADTRLMYGMGSKASVHEEAVLGRSNASVADYAPTGWLREYACPTLQGPGLYVPSVEHQSHRKTPWQKEFITDLFLAGEGAANKLKRKNAAQMEASMAAAVDQNGRRLFSAGGSQGIALQEHQIKGMVGSLSSKSKKGALPGSGEEVFWSTFPVDKLREIAGGINPGSDISKTKKDAVVRLIMAQDEQWRKDKRPVPNMKHQVHACRPLPLVGEGGQKVVGVPSAASSSGGLPVPQTSQTSLIANQRNGTASGSSDNMAAGRSTGSGATSMAKARQACQPAAGNAAGTAGLCGYEKRRQAKIARNKAFLEGLGLGGGNTTLSGPAHSKKQKRSQHKKKRKQATVDAGVPKRRSKRVRNIAPTPNAAPPPVTARGNVKRTVAALASTTGLGRKELPGWNARTRDEEKD